MPKLVQDLEKTAGLEPPSDHRGSTRAPVPVIRLTAAQQQFVQARQAEVARIERALKDFLYYVVTEAGADPSISWALVGNELVPQQSLKPTTLR